MAFDRNLSDTFITGLQNLAKDPSSWWSKIRKSKHLFVAIRKNTIGAYAGGASIAKVGWKGSRCVLKVHKKYLVLPPKGPNYVELGDRQRGPDVQTVKSERDFAEHLDQIKEAAALLGGEERAGANLVAAGHSCFLDLEAAFDGGDADDAGPGTQKRGRVDLVAVDSQGRLVFIEAKLHSNGELRSRRDVPDVCGQLADYARWIDREGATILEAYRRAWTLRQQLGLPRPSRMPEALDPIPRLLIFGFSSSDRTDLDGDVTKILEGLRTRLPRFGRQCVLRFGSPRSFHLESARQRLGS